jgi:RimJ/RimL family protein N-acetyltransferase
MGSNLSYRHIQKEDVESVSNYVSDPRVSKYLTWKSYSDSHLISEYVSKSVSKISYPDEVLVVIYKKNIIGTVHIIARQKKVAQFGFGIIPSFWGNGFGLNIITDMISYINRSEWKKRCNVIWAHVHMDNIWVQKQLISFGFISERKEIEPNRYQFMYKL